MRAFEIGPDVPFDLEEGFAWYESKQLGLGADFADVAADAIRGISRHGEYVTAPYERLATGNVRRVFLERFPYRVFFLETEIQRIVLRLLHNHQDDAHWRSRV
jgi:hypothetical protein